jgi:acyl dehydratase
MAEDEVTTGRRQTRTGLLVWVGKELGRSAQCEVTQRQVDRFVDATYDQNGAHIHPESARAGLYGSATAHDILALSLCRP